MPWARLVQRPRPFCPKGARGRLPIGLERMPRIHFLQQWHEEAVEDALYDSQALRGFAGIDPTVTAVPEAATILNFRHWLVGNYSIDSARRLADHAPTGRHGASAR
jgi:transposase, IS5 family